MQNRVKNSKFFGVVPLYAPTKKPVKFSVLVWRDRFCLRQVSLR